jgi:GTP-binding protein
MAPMDEGVDPVEQVRAIENELRRYDPAMLEKPRWLVLNKADLLDEEETAERVADVVKRLGWTAPHFVVSAISREGTRPIMLKVQQFFDDLKHQAAEAAEDAAWVQRNAPTPPAGEGA